MNLRDEIQRSVLTSLIDKEINSNENLRPEFIYNDHTKGMKVLNTIINELNNCDEFIISVAFITESGLILLLNTLMNLEKKGIRGKILTSDYLNFNEAKALRKLRAFSNIELKICAGDNFHSKGYIFKKGETYSLLIGSSNLTQNGLTINNEWNLRLVSLSRGKLIEEILNEFDTLWEETPSLTDEWLNNYEIINSSNYVRVLQFVQNRIEQRKEIKPNKMQREALEAIKEQRAKGINKTLLISATGTGKTYLAAFDVKEFQPKKMLFVVHREQIAREAKRSFKRVIGNNINATVLSGRNRDIKDADYIFSTIQSLSKDEVLHSFPKDHFDYICIDEVHRAGAVSYQKILNYFMPRFVLGMSATPERTDGYNIYELFDYNIAYEIRLQQALAENMLCPFHYFGVTEIKVNGVEIDDETKLNYLIAEERVNHIIEKINFYGYSGSRVKGLIFCSSKDECRELSRMFNEHGFQTIALTGENTQEEREDAIERLQLPERTEKALDYIFTVDIFNEGVDIPKINQIVMLRPTESAIIFVQQLGRGLRLDREKEFLVVIDFIANYKKNFLIPIALSGDKTYKKDTLRRFVTNGTSIIPGASTIQFDEISKQKIYESINRTNFSTLKFLGSEYVDLKNKLNKIPTLVDLYVHGSIDPELIFNHSKSYYNFLLKVEKSNIPTFDPKKISSLEFLSREVANAKRVHEIIILKELLENHYTTLDLINEIIKNKYNPTTKMEDIYSSFNVINSQFQAEKFKLDFPIIQVEEKTLTFSETFTELLNDEKFYNFVHDLVNYSLLKFEKEYMNNESGSNFVLYQKYSRKEVLRLLNWPKDESSVVYGYRIKYNTCPIFVTYHKSENISETTKYQDEFIDHYTFSWMSKNRRTLESPEVIEIINSKQNKTKLYLFVKKNDDEGSEFYYLGEVQTIDGMWEQVTIKDKHNKDVPVVKFKFRMVNPVRSDIYDYFTKVSESNEENN